ncbi:hypothetical protein [Methylomonas koyamae]|uniref:hypothetical protein n=1 Tax=Methylomonas koyamae TaxID=702114 RepID=UPI002872D1EF|nr:hypothetical protein [Methylomonas koyamae]WNB76905.1 hypothetical protein RI210_04865 [Methylomonas koyamae]
MAEKYEEQLARVKRYFERFSKINGGISHTQESPNYDDDIYAFFQNCYHLKDWIKNDTYCKTWNVEEFINSNPELQICADICNGRKHLKLTKPPRSNEAPKFAGREIKLNLGQGAVIAIKYTITTNSGEIDAFELGQKCIAAWESFIVSKSPTP